MGKTNKFRLALGVDEVTSNTEIWKALTAEFVGVFILVLVGCGSCILNWGSQTPPSIAEISLAFGLTVAVVVQCIGHVSGGHINPAVTLAMLVVGKVSIIRAILYILSQCVGAIAGAAILKAITPEQYQATLGTPSVNEDISPVQGFGIEFLVTFVLVLTVFSVCDGNRIDNKGSAAIIIGLSVTTCHLFGIKYTGASMNSARVFGPAVISGRWKDHWVYWLGPCLGGMAAGILYHYVYTAPSPPQEEYEPALLQKYRNDKGSKEIVEDRTTAI